MDWFKCLFCVESLKDSELICAASCEHFIHEWCLATMRSMGERHCKICEKDIVVHSVFKEFDLGRAIQVAGIPLMIKMLDEIIKLHNVGFHLIICFLTIISNVLGSLAKLTPVN